MSRIFSAPVERIHLVSGAFLTVLSLPLFLFWNETALKYSKEEGLLVGIAFLNAVHITQTLLFPVRHHAFRQTIQQVFKKPLVATSFLATAVFIVFYLGKMFAQEFPLSRDLTSLILFFMPTFHILWQIKGLNLIYTKKLNFGGQEEKRYRLEQREKYLFYAISFFHFMACFSMVLGLKQLSFLKLTSNSLYAKIFVFFEILSILFLITGRFRMPGIAGKRWFLLRLLVFPLFPFYPVTILILTITHSLEYIFLFFSIDQNSGTKVFKSSMALSLLVLLVALPTYIPQYFSTEFAGAMYGLYWSLAVLHYYLDGKLFKMKDPAVRENIGPLLRS